MLRWPPIVASSVLCAAAACGPGTTGTDPEPTPCAIEVEGGGDIGLTAAVGRTSTFSLTVTAGAELEVTQVGPGVEVTLPSPDGEGAGALEVWVAYDAPDALSVTLGATCAAPDETALDATTALTVAFDARRPRWEATPSWTPGDDGPPGREYFSFWRAPDDADTAYVFGGFHYEPVQFTIANDMWSYDLAGGSWTEMTVTGAPLLAGGGFALDADGRGLHYGGLGEDASGNFILPFSLHEVTWSGTTAAFSTLLPSGAPSTAAYQPALLYDAPRERFVTVGGQGLAGPMLDVAAYDPADDTFSSLDIGGLDDPDGRTGFFWAWDEVTERVFVFSGERGGGAGGSCNCAQDTWALELGEDPPRWSLIDDGTSGPPGRRNGAYALDPVGRRLLVWGGTSDGATTQPGLWALRLDRGKERWDEVIVDAAEDVPAIRSSGGMLYDAARDRMVVGFGNDSIVGARNDLWSLSF